jgi:hypothetical protein
VSKAFDNAEQVGSICWQIRQSDYPRGMNRARINDLFNGKPPFTDEAVQRDGIAINVNPLTGTRLAHDARAQFYSAFLKPGRFFTASVDRGPTHRRQIWSSVVTEEINKIMKRSLPYYEKFRSVFAMDVLHGIGPSAWKNAECWRPDAVGVEDIGIPAKTYLTMENLPFFYVYRSLTAPELMRLTHDEECAKKAGWNMKLVKRCIEYLDKESMQLMGSNFPEIWSPEKVAERVKGDGGFYVGDQVPTIDAYDFYFYSDEGEQSGWCRRIVLDSWSTPPGVKGAEPTRNRDLDFAMNQFLFSTRNRKWASKREEIIHFQFADLSAVAPFQYHSVRSLGFLTYAVCHLQNRLYCKFQESVFEALMNYFRVKTADEAERAMKIKMVNRGFIDDTVAFVKPEDRWQVNEALVELGMQENQKLIDTNSSSYTQNYNQQQGSKERKTKMQVMAEMNSMSALVAAALNQAYQYQAWEYYEIVRRFMRKNSRDVDVSTFRANCLRRGVDEKVLIPECWEVQPSRVMGAGNKTLEMAISEQLLSMRPLFDPEPQREILRDVVLNLTDDAARADRLVPEQPLKVSDSVHDAQLAAAALMMGLPVSVKTGMDHQEYIVTLLQDLQQVIQQAQQSGGMMQPDKIQGCQAIAQHIQQHLQILSQDKNEKEFVANAEKALSKLMNEVRAFMQRLQQMMKKQQQSNGAGGEGAAKAQAQIIAAKTKAQIQQQSHSQKAAQRQIAFQKEEQRKDEEFNRDQARLDAETAGDIQRMHMEAITQHRLRALDADNESTD